MKIKEIINKKVGVVIQVRSSSKRLKNKFRKIIEKDSLINFLIKRIIKFNKNLNLIICIPKSDEVIYSHLKKIKNLQIFRGSKNNVLDRYYKCALKFNLNTIVRLTGDNPLVDLNLMFNNLKNHIKKKKSFTTNCHENSFPNGLEFEIINIKLLEYVWKHAVLNSDKEHVTPFIYRLIKSNKISKKKILLIKDKLQNSKLRFTVDKQNDFDLVKIIYKKLKYEKLKISYPNIIKIYKKNKRIFNINKNEIRDFGYLQSVKRD